MKIFKRIKFMWIGVLIMVISLMLNSGCGIKQYFDKDTEKELSPALNALVLTDTSGLLLYTTAKSVADSAYQAQKISLKQYYDAKRALCVFNGLLFLFNDEVKALYKAETVDGKITSKDVATSMIKTLATDGDQMIEKLKLALGDKMDNDIVNTIWDVVKDLK